MFLSRTKKFEQNSNKQIKWPLYCLKIFSYFEKEISGAGKMWKNNRQKSHHTRYVTSQNSSERRIQRRSLFQRPNEHSGYNALIYNYYLQFTSFEHMVIELGRTGSSKQLVLNCEIITIENFPKSSQAETKIFVFTLKRGIVSLFQVVFSGVLIAILCFFFLPSSNIMYHITLYSNLR